MAIQEKADLIPEELSLVDDKGQILVVDDDRLVLAALEMTLKREGYDVFTANNGGEAVSLLENISPALIICDQTMPGMQGIEVLQKAHELRPESIRILLTASHDVETAIEAINVGHVSQYITKPWKDTQFRKTIKTALEKYKLVRENQVLQKLILSQHAKLQKTHENLCHELQIGGQIHEQMLLGKVPKDVLGMSIEAMSVPSKEIDGDFFEFYRPTPETMDMVIGDVMGKGIAAALVGTAVKTQMIRFAMPFPYSQAFEKKQGWYSNLLSPEEILSQVNKEVGHKLIELGYFVSLFFCRFNLQYKTLSFIDCGSTKPIHYRAKDRTVMELIGNNFPLGVVEKDQYRTIETRYNEGDILVFYSDGVTEARSETNEFFGSERLIELIKNNGDLRASALVDLIKRAVLSFTKKEKTDDDLTLIVIKMNHYDKPDRAQVTATQFCSDLSQLQAVRDFIKRFCLRAPGDSERLANEMQLIVNEAFCNIVKHGYLEGVKKPIKIEAELENDMVVVKIADQGLPFDPAMVNDPSFSGNRDTGYGWHIIKELTDKVCYIRKRDLEGWNHLILVKRYYFGDTKMNLRHKAEGNVLVVVPESESLDARDASEFKETVIGLINDNNYHSVVFELNNLQFIDSSGLGSFLSVLRVLNSRGGDLKLSGLNRPIRTMFELVKMHKIFEIFNSTDEALRSFK